MDYGGREGSVEAALAAGTASKETAEKISSETKSADVTSPKTSAPLLPVSRSTVPAELATHAGTCVDD